MHMHMHMYNLHMHMHAHDMHSLYGISGLKHGSHSLLQRFKTRIFFIRDGAKFKKNRACGAKNFGLAALARQPDHHPPIHHPRHP